MEKAYRERVIDGFNNEGIFIRSWEKVENPKGIVQIIHGMAEHSLRYDHFAKFLNSNGYIVYGSDHRGHGETGKNTNLYGYLGENGFNNVVEDQFMITKFIKKENENLPIHIVAHSFGSFVGQEYITRYSNEIEGITFSGSCKQDGFDVKLGLFVANLQSKIFDEKSKAKFLDKMAFLSFNKEVKNKKTKMDWLTRDEDEVSKYLNDEACGFCPTINFYKSLFTGFKHLYKNEKLEKIRKDLKINIVSGDKDPVGKYGIGVNKLYEQYKDLNIEKVRVKLFKDGRHEMINETNKDEVYNYILENI
ncbi:MAG: alpha/beta fold hydrolase [Clostridium sp.]